MPPVIAENAVFIAIAIALLLLGLWLFLRANRKTTIIGDEASGTDVLDEGAARAGRNQALIDAAPAAVTPVEPEPKAPELVETAPAVAPPVASMPSPAPAAPAPTAPSAQGGDDLKRIKGIGPKLVSILAEQGVTSFAQIAAWSEADIARVDAGLGRFRGRITRDKWVDQAKLLAAGDEASFNETFGNNG